MPTDKMIKHLDVELTLDEWRLRGRERGEAEEEIEELKAEMKRQVESHKEKLGKLEARVAELGRIMRAGAEKRPIECVIERDFARGVRLVWRTDRERGTPGALVETIAMTSEERQITLPIDPKPKKGEGKSKKADAKKADEQPAEGAATEATPAPAPANEAEPPIERPGKACETCSMADGNHHPDCAPIQAEENATGEAKPAESPAAKPAEEPLDRRGIGEDGATYPITKSEADACAAGKTVKIKAHSDGGEREIEIVRLATPSEIAAFEALNAKDDDPAPESGPTPDYSAAAKVAGEQLATGERPEEATDEDGTPREDADEEPKKGQRGRPRSKAKRS